MTNKYEVTNKLQQVLGLNIWADESQSIQTHYGLGARATVVFEEWQCTQDLQDKYSAGLIRVRKLVGDDS